MDNVLSIPFLSMVMVSDWMLIARKGPGAQLDNLFQVPVLKDDAKLSIGATSGCLETKKVVRLKCWRFMCKTIVAVLLLLL